MVITFTFKVDEFEEPELIKWLKSFSKTDRVRSYHIRQALKTYIKGGEIRIGGSIPRSLENVQTTPDPSPKLVIETGDIITESHGKQGKNEEELLALLDSQF